MTVGIWVTVTAALLAPGLARGAALSETAQPAAFGDTCAPCHGFSAQGTDRAPSLVANRALQGLSAGAIARIIAQGREGVMPAFSNLPVAEIAALASYVHSLNTNAFEAAPPGDVGAGRRMFFGSGHCADCHTAEGRGEADGPDLSNIGRMRTIVQLVRALRHPQELRDRGWNLVTVFLSDGRMLRGFARGRTQHGIDLQTLDGRLHPVVEDEYRSIVPAGRTTMPPFTGSAGQLQDLVAFLSRLHGVPTGPDLASHDRISRQDVQTILHPRAGDWTTYSGNVDGNRFSALTQINAGNVSSLQPVWVRPLPYSPLETTPLVIGGIMYVTGPNQIYALDARTGGMIWSYSRPRGTASTVAVDAAKGANRGVAVLGERLYFITDDAHLLCLQRVTGALLWDVRMPPRGAKARYGGTSAPLVAGRLVIAGVSGGDEAIRGFVAAYDPITGRRVWRFWTVPRPGDRAYKTWRGDPAPLGGATWLTGSYDPEAAVLYMGVGNPYPDTDGDQRLGDDLYTDSDVALDARTGKLLWYFQFTPHDLHDWDAVQPIVLADTRFRGRMRELLLHANRNGFFYVLDAANGKFLQGTRFVNKLNWAKGIATDGRPILLPADQTSLSGTRTCPAVRGATNWYSTAFDPATGLYYVMSVEDCSIYRKSEQGGDYLPIKHPEHRAMKVLRALRVDGGEVAWQVPLRGNPENNYSGVLATAGGLVFFAETTGAIAAVDAATGRYLWHFGANQPCKGSPMTYSVDGRQYIAIASGPNILSFALPAGAT